MSLDDVWIDAVFLTNTANQEFYSMTSKAIESLLDSWKNTNLFIIESNEKSWDYPGLVVQPKESFKYNKFMNIGINMGSSETILMCNNDIVFEKESVKELLDGMNKYGLESASPHEMRFHGDNKFGINYAQSEVIYGYQVEKVITGWCIAAKREMIKRLNPLDEDLIFWYQDNHYANVLEQNGVKHGLITRSKVRHISSQSHTLLENRYDMTIGQRQVFESKWAR